MTRYSYILRLIYIFVSVCETGPVRGVWLALALSQPLLVKVKVKECASYLWKSISQLWSVTCRMGSHSVTFHPTQANTPRLYPSPTGWYSIYRPFKDGGLSKPFLVIYAWPLFSLSV